VRRKRRSRTRKRKEELCLRAQPLLLKIKRKDARDCRAAEVHLGLQHGRRRRPLSYLTSRGTRERLGPPLGSRRRKKDVYDSFLKGRSAWEGRSLVARRSKEKKNRHLCFWWSDAARPLEEPYPKKKEKIWQYYVGEGKGGDEGSPTRGPFSLHIETRSLLFSIREGKRVPAPAPRGELAAKG